MRDTVLRDADVLWPLIEPKVRAQVRAAFGVVGGGSGGVAEHELGGNQHKGTLRNDQAPQFLLVDGTRQLEGNLPVAAGVTVDGVDLSAHAANPDAHHAKQHVLANASGLGADHTISGAVAGWVLRATASNAARMAQLLVTDLGATGLNFDVVALTAANTVGLRTPASDVTAPLEALLKSNAAGEIALAGLKIGAGVGAMIFSGSGNIANFPDIQFTANALLAVEQSLYIALDSDNNATGAALIVGHNSSTTTGFQELFRVNDLGEAIVQAKLRVPLLDTASGNMTFQPAGDMILDPGGNDVLPGANYQVNLGAINRKYLTLWAAELWVETLVAQNTIATIGGRILVGPTTTLTRDLGSAAGDTTVYVKHNQMSAGDRVYMEANGAVEFMAITSAPTTITAGVEYSYTVTRNLDGTGRNQWYSGDAMFNTGQVGNGFIDLYSLSGIPRNGQSGQRAGPTIVGNVRLGTIYNNFRERWAIGNLNALYDYGNNEYGAAFGDPTAAWIGMDAVNGVRIMDGADVRAQLDIDGNFSMYDAAQYLYQAGLLVANLTPAYGLDFLVYDTPSPSDYVRQIAWWKDLATRTTPVARAFAATYSTNNDYFELLLDRTGQNSNSITLTANNGSLARMAQLKLITYSIASGYQSIASLTAQNILFSSTPRVGADWGTAKAFWHAGNLINPLDFNTFAGDFRSSAAVMFRNAGATAYQSIGVQDISANGNAYIYGGGIYSNVAIGFLNTSAQAQAIYAGHVLVSNDYSHGPRIPANGMYVLGNISTSGGISSYAADLYLARAGVSKVGMFTWGTYAYGSLTLDDILNIAAVQTTEPAAPANGVKLYLINRTGVIWLEAKFANGAVRQIVKNA